MEDKDEKGGRISPAFETPPNECIPLIKSTFDSCEDSDLFREINAEFDKLDDNSAENNDYQSNNNLSAESEIIGMLKVEQVNSTMREAAKRENPIPLYYTLWYTGEVCCLFSDSNLGKSILAVQICTEISKEQTVLYCDFELSDKQFQLRYTDKVTGKLYEFPENFFRVSLNPDTMDVEKFEDNLINNIELAAIQKKAKIIVIDNITYLCAASEKGDLAGRLMMRLVALKKKYGWSLLILAHTPKRPLTNPITQNDLAGSKKLYNFFDSVFAIGKSAKDSNLRYLKQLKCRYGEFEFDSDNIPIYSIEQTEGFLGFIFAGYGTEREHLKEQTDSDLSQLIEGVKQLSAQGKTIREIAKELNISKSKVGRILKK